MLSKHVQYTFVYNTQYTFVIYISTYVRMCVQYMQKYTTCVIISCYYTGIGIKSVALISIYVNVYICVCYSVRWCGCLPTCGGGGGDGGGGDGGGGDGGGDGGDGGGGMILRWSLL